MGWTKEKGRRPTIFITALRLVCATAYGCVVGESWTPLYIACAATERRKSSTGGGKGQIYSIMILISSYRIYCPMQPEAVSQQTTKDIRPHHTKLNYRKSIHIVFLTRYMY